MVSLTSGTLNYEIPLPAPYRVRCGYPLVIKHCETNQWIVECPAFDEWGDGKTYAEALDDLGSSLVDYWLSLRRLVERKKILGSQLLDHLSLLNETIIEKGKEVENGNQYK